MKKCYPFLSLLTIILATTYSISFSQTMTFNYTATIQTWTVPAGVTAIFVDVQGAQGGAVGTYPGVGLTPLVSGTPGCGGRVQATLAVTPGQILTINVGGSGAIGSGYLMTPGGYNGGGSTETWAPADLGYSGGSGGGMTDISSSGTELVVGGGGGGAGYNGGCALSGQPGGNGGGPIGDSATTCDATLRTSGYLTIIHSGGGTQTAGGAGGYICCGYTYYAGTAGSLGAGGNNVDSGGIGGGGGGGYYGGGGGCWMGGGGGSSYTNPSYTTSVTHTQGYNCSSGIVVICVLPDPGAISGITTVCGATGTTSLSDASASGGTWSSANTAVATVDPTGLVTGVTGGTAVISYTVSNSCGTIAATATVNIITAGTITGKDSVCQHRTDSLSDLITGGQWSSLFTTIATVGSISGVVTGVTPGTDTIYYNTTISGCNVKATFYLKVKSAASCISGVTELAGDEPAIKVIPNPGPGVFSITLSSAIDEETQFLVTNMLGEKISEVSGVTNKPVTLRLEVPAGVYILTAATAHGKFTEKIMVIK